MSEGLPDRSVTGRDAPASPLDTPHARIIPAGKVLQQVKFEIDWMSFSNDDLADDEDPNPGPDDGWYVAVTVGSRSHQIGPDHYGPGFASMDEAMALCRKWAEDRGFKWDPPSLDFALGKWVEP